MMMTIPSMKDYLAQLPTSVSLEKVLLTLENIDDLFKYANKEIAYLSFLNCGFEALAIKQLASHLNNHPSLQSLTLSGYFYHNADEAKTSHFHRVNIDELNYLLSALEENKTLKCLDLSQVYPLIMPQEFKSISFAKLNVSSLNLFGLPLSSKHTKELAENNALKKITLFSTFLSPQDIIDLTKSKSIQDLFIEQGSLMGRIEVVKAISAMPQLKNLCISEVDLDGAIVLAKNKTLQGLMVNGKNYGDTILNGNDEDIATIPSSAQKFTGPSVDSILSQRDPKCYLKNTLAFFERNEFLPEPQIPNKTLKKFPF
jgi:hypothetical protein